MLSANYDALTRTLEIEFHRGTTYQYLDVPEADFKALLIAPSKGAYFHRHILSVFRFRRIA
jgi:hypothetical protein